MRSIHVIYIFIQSKKILVLSCLPSWIPYPLPLILLCLLLHPYEDEEECKDEEECEDKEEHDCQEEDEAP